MRSPCKFTPAFNKYLLKRCHTQGSGLGSVCANGVKHMFELPKPTFHRNIT